MAESATGPRSPGPTAPPTLADVVATSQAVASTRSRLAKTAALAELLTRARDAGDGTVRLVAHYLAGVLPQGRIGVGPAALARLPSPATAPSLTLDDVDGFMDRLASVAGAGSKAARAALVDDLFSRATSDEQRYLAGILRGDLRQGALDAGMRAAIAQASGARPAAVDRAAMLSGDTALVAIAALTGGDAALDEIRLEVGRAVSPMLAASAPDLDEALTRVGDGAVVDCKLDGVRIQIHRDGDRVRLFTRSLDDITHRLPEVVDAARGLVPTRYVMDAEALAFAADGRPLTFAQTMSRVGRRSRGPATSGTPLSLQVFDVLHLDDEDLIDRPLAERLERLDAAVPPELRPPRATGDADALRAFEAACLERGHEGVMVKDPASPYAAGRRGSAWIKVKPRRTLDLVVLGADWGSGRRRGTLSNIHLGAREPDGGFVLLGKTFKGMTDEMLAWQTARFLELEDHRDGMSVYVRPEQVVEIALDSVLRSRRYPGGVALRFARVLRYRDDKAPGEVDTIDDVRAMMVGGADDEA